MSTGSTERVSDGRWAGPSAAPPGRYAYTNCPLDRALAATAANNSPGLRSTRFATRRTDGASYVINAAAGRSSSRSAASLPRKSPRSIAARAFETGAPRAPRTVVGVAGPTDLAVAAARPDGASGQRLSSARIWIAAVNAALSGEIRDQGKVLCLLVIARRLGHVLQLCEFRQYLSPQASEIVSHS